jgi:uncharacterized protein YndB with AHSA1/START domain
MTISIKPAPVRRSVTVPVPQERAFDVFTAHMGKWWPASHSIGSSSQKVVRMEPRPGGRWYELGEDGQECDWGEVLEWDRPRRLVLAWRITADWRFDPELLTEVEVRFTEIEETRTRVDLEHRLLENYGDRAEAARNTLDSEGGWPLLVDLYAKAVAAG